MRALAIAALLTGVALAGCGKSSSDPVKREPGNWKTELKIVDMDMPGMPPAMKEAALKQALPATTECLSKEAAAKEDPAKEFSKGTGECTFTKNNFGAKVDVAGTCKGPGGKDMTMTMTGTFEPKKIDLDVSSSGPSPMGNGNMTSKMKITATNIGPC